MSKAEYGLSSEEIKIKIGQIYKKDRQRFVSPRAKPPAAVDGSEQAQTSTGRPNPRRNKRSVDEMGKASPRLQAMLTRSSMEKDIATQNAVSKNRPKADKTTEDTAHVK